MMSDFMYGSENEKQNGQQADGITPSGGTNGNTGFQQDVNGIENAAQTVVNSGILPCVYHTHCAWGCT